MAGFTKLCSEIVTSSIWNEDNATRIVWVTMLALADSDGRVDAALPGLARASNVTLEECQTAIQKLSAPDPYSRTPDHEGRRICPVDGGWLILNYAKYRKRRDPEERKRQNREAKQRQRERESQPPSADVSQCQPQAAHGRGQRAEAEKNKYIVPDGTVRADKPSTLEEKNFELARVLWPGKKRGFRTEFDNFRKHHRDWKSLLDDDGLRDCVQVLIDRKAYSPGYWPMFATWTNQNRYEEALQPPEVCK